jgi:hypothetical protein
MEKSQHYQAGIQQYDHSKREELMRSRAVPGITTTGIPVKYYSFDYKFPRGMN